MAIDLDAALRKAAGTRAASVVPVVVSLLEENWLDSIDELKLAYENRATGTAWGQLVAASAAVAVPGLFFDAVARECGWPQHDGTPAAPRERGTPPPPLWPPAAVPRRSRRGRCS